MIVDIGYLNVRGLHDNHSKNINQAPPTPQGTDYNTERPLFSQYPQLGDLPISEAAGGSWYDALTARFAANIGKATAINASYAHGRNFANGNNGNINNLDESNINQYYGPTSKTLLTYLMRSYEPNFQSAGARDSWAIPTAWWMPSSAAGNIPR